MKGSRGYEKANDGHDYRSRPRADSHQRNRPDHQPQTDQDQTDTGVEGSRCKHSLPRWYNAGTNVE
jgi:hypothetical protein